MALSELLKVRLVPACRIHEILSHPECASSHFRNLAFSSQGILNTATSALTVAGHPGPTALIRVDSHHRLESARSRSPGAC